MSAKRKGGRRKKFTNKQIETALREASGIVAVAARILKTSRRTIYVYINGSKHLQEVYAEINETTIDVVEGELMSMTRNRMHKDQFQAIRYYLNCKARDRGYGERLEHVGNTDEPIPLVWADKPSPQSDEN